MKSQNGNIKLIESLNGSEKRYVSIYLKKKHGKGESNSLRLFNQYAGSLNSSSHPPVTFKNKKEEDYLLQRHILNSIHLFHVNGSNEARINRAIHQTKLLLDKGLATLALKLINKNKRICREWEYFDQLLKILQLERRAILYFASKNIEQELLRNINEKEHVAKQIYDISRIASLADQLYLFHRKVGVVRTESAKKILESYFSNPILSSDEELESSRSKMWYWYCHRMKGFMLQDIDLLLKTANEYVKVVEGNTFLIKEQQGRYSTGLNLLVQAYKNANLMDEAIETIEKIKNIPKDYPSKDVINEAFLYNNIYSEEMDIYYQMGNFKKALEVAKELESNWEAHSSVLMAESFVVKAYDLGKVYFSAGYYDKTLDQIDPVLNGSYRNLREDIQFILAIMRLLIHFELKNMRYLPFAWKSVYRFMKSRKLEYEVEKRILMKIRDLIKSTDNNKMQFYISLKELIDSLNTNDIESLGLEYFDFSTWLRSKIEDRPFEDLLAKRFKK